MPGVKTKDRDLLDSFPFVEESKILCERRTAGVIEHGVSYGVLGKVQGKIIAGGRNMRGPLAATAGLILFVLWFEPLDAKEKPRIFAGASSKTLGYSPFWVATKKGFFEQQGLDVQLVLLRGVPRTLQVLAAGSLQFSKEMRLKPIHACKGW